jgi:hypothetical protein
MQTALLTAVSLIAAAVAAPVPKPAPPKDRVVSNPSKDIHVVTDRDESVKGYFTRTRLVVGWVPMRKESAEEPGISDVLEATDTVKLITHRPSLNDETDKGWFGMPLKVAPPKPAVVELLKGIQKRNGVELIFRKGDDGLHHLVGYTTRKNDGFFSDDTVNKDDGYSPRDLRFVEEKK